MRASAWLSLLCGAACSVACLVKSFEVDPAPTEGAAGDDNGSAGTSNNIPSGPGPQHIGESLFHDSASGSDSASAHLTDATFELPAGTKAGDFLLVFFGSDHTLHLTTQTLGQMGWTLHDQHGEQGDDGQGTYLLYRFADGTEPTSIVFPGINDNTYGNGVQGLLTVYRGVNKTKPVNAYEVAQVDHGTDDMRTIETPTPAVTTSVGNCLLIAGLSPDSAVDAPVVTSWPEGFDEHQVSVQNPTNPNPFGWANIYSAERHLAKAGSVPGSKFVWDIATPETVYHGALSFVLALAPAE
jgi:hypothetical protein